MLIRVSFAKDVPQYYDCKIKNFREEGGTGGSEDYIPPGSDEEEFMPLGPKAHFR